MSSAVGGAGGGRSFPIFIDLILRGAPQVAQQLKGVVTPIEGLTPITRTATTSLGNLERGLTTAGQGAVFTSQGMRTGSTETAKFNATLTPLSASAARTGVSMQSMGGAMQGTVRHVTDLNSGVMPLNSAMNTLGTTATNTTSRMSALSAVKITLKENIRGLIFPLGGLFGALNEAAFMSGRLGDAERKVAEAQAVLTDLTNKGQEGTTAYTQAQKDLNDAQRGYNFTARITTQSWFDMVFFLGTLSGSMTGVIQRYKELRASGTTLTGSITNLTTRVGGLKGTLTSLVGGLSNLIGGLGGTQQQFIKTYTSSGLVSQGFVKQAVASTILSGATAKTTVASNLLAQGLPAIRTGTTEVTRSMKGAIPAMVGGQAAATGLAGGLKAAAAEALALSGPIALVAAGVASWAALTVAQNRNIGGLDDKMKGLTNTISGFLSQLSPQMEEFYDQMVFLGELQRAQIDNWLSQAPLIGEYIKNTDDASGATKILNREMIGVADATKVYGVAIDGSLVAVNDLKKENMNLAATAATVLEKNGQLGAAMKILGTDMTITGDVAVRAAGYFLEQGQAAQEAAQKDFNLVAAHYGLQTAMRLSAQQTQDLAAWLTASGEAAEEGEASLTPYAAAVKKAADAAGLSVEVTNENAAAMGDAAAAAATEAREEEKRAAAADMVTEALIGLNLESQALVNTNAQIVASVRGQTQQFDEAAVGMAAMASGVQTWRDELSQAYFNIVETSTALGFMGDTTKANVVEMLEFTAVQQRLNEGNAESVETYFQLDAAQKQSLETYGITSQLMGQVALGVADLSAEQVGAISSTGELNDINKQAAEAYFELDEATRAALEALGLDAQVMQQVQDGTIQLTDAQVAAVEVQTELNSAIQEHANAIAALLPGVRQLAEAYNVTSIAGEQNNVVFAAVTENLTALDGKMRSGIQSLVDFAISNGAVFDASEMTVTGLVELVATMDLSGETAEEAAARHKKAAEDLAAAWEAELEKAVQAWETSSEAFATAAENITDEIGDAGAEGAIKFTEGFLTEFVPQQVIEEAFDKNIDVEDLIDDIQDEAESALDDGLISPIAMRDAVQPMLDEMERIPDNTERSMGKMIAIARHTMTNLKPVIVGGIHEVGRDAVKAMESGVLKPLESALAAGGGTGVWQPLIDNFKRTVEALPPEYDRLKGDFLGTLELMKGDTRAQINAILPILREINPEWAAMIEEMDADGDGIKDIFDNDVRKPADEMRRSLLTTFADIFTAWAQVNPEFAKAAEHLKGVIAGMDSAAASAGNMAGPVDAVTGKVLGFSQAAWDSLPPMTQMNQQLLAQQLAADKAAGAVQPYVGIVQGFSTAQWNALTPMQRVNEQLAAHQAALDGASGAATTATGSLNLTAGAANGLGVGATGATAAIGGTNVAAANLNATLTETTAMSAVWYIHAQSVQASINGIIIPSLQVYGSNLDGAYTNVATKTIAMTANWQTHGSSVSSIISGSINNALNRYAAFTVRAQSTIESATTDMSVNWNSHQQSLRGQVSSMTGHLNRLASAVNSTMSRIVSAMNRGASAANNLRAAINRLQNKTITVTTRYRTVGRAGATGRAGAQHGFEGVISSPTRLTVGEKFKPEFVYVQPLTEPVPGGTIGGTENKAVNVNVEGNKSDTTRAVIHQPRAAAMGGGGGGGGSGINIDALVSAIVAASARHPIQLFIDGRQVTNVVRARINEGYDSMR
jgi:hypothetical protein